MLTMIMFAGVVEDSQARPLLQGADREGAGDFSYGTGANSVAMGAAVAVRSLKRRVRLGAVAYVVLCNGGRG
jgi:hypothetical protein